MTKNKPSTLQSSVTSASNSFQVPTSIFEYYRFICITKTILKSQDANKSPAIKEKGDANYTRSSWTRVRPNLHRAGWLTRIIQSRQAERRNVPRRLSSGYLMLSRIVHRCWDRSSFQTPEEKLGQGIIRG